ncbi:MAG: hypothetical protein U1E73_09535 [Planctomycetota bacterium]
MRRYKRRWVVERFFAWLNGFRRLIVRHERHSLMYRAFVHVACVLVSMRLCETASSHFMLGSPDVRVGG